MARQRPTINITIDPEVHEGLKQVSGRTGVPVSKLLEGLARERLGMPSLLVMPKLFNPHTQEGD